MEKAIKRLEKNIRNPCRKVRFFTREEALTTSRRAGRYFGEPYICHKCLKITGIEYWHLGNRIPKKSKLGVKIKKIKKLFPYMVLLRTIDYICGIPGHIYGGTDATDATDATNTTDKKEV